MKKYIAPELLAYIAGLFDGEGCVHIAILRPKNRSLQHQLRTTISNSNPEPLRIVQGLFGGIIQYTLPYENHRQVYSWHGASRCALYFLESIYQYLIIKKEEARLGIEFQRNKKWERPLSREQLNWRERLRIKLVGLKGVEYYA